MKQILLLLFLSTTILVLSSIEAFAQAGLYKPIDIDTVKYSLKDFGKMWTFDEVPVDNFEKQYGFKPSIAWLESVQKSALQFGGGCSAAFVSEDGLIMTNHHCGRRQLTSLQNEGENMLRDGFYAETLEDERLVPNLFVDQLIRIEDATDEIQNEMLKGKNDSEIIALRDSAKAKLIRDSEAESGLVCKVVTLYNGGKYSLYFYKRYSDIRLVMAPDFQIAATGWDWDNFTYPRYELDFMFYRAYDESGKPVKTENHFTWSKKGATEDEVLFVVGRPGSTDRQLSVVQLEYLRDVVYTNRLLMFEELYQVYFELFNKHPERESELLNKVMGYGNGRKSYAGRLYGLSKPVLMAKKISFEKELRTRVNESKELTEKYGNLWDEIESVILELRKSASEYYGYAPLRRSVPVYFKTANSLIEYANEMKKEETERSALYKNENIENTISNIYPDSIDVEFNNLLFRAHVNTVTNILGSEDKLLQNLYGGKTGAEAVEFALNNSVLNSKEKTLEIIELSPDEILNYDDSIIKFMRESQVVYDSLSTERDSLQNRLLLLNQKLGEAIFEVFGDRIPPDATRTLRISDGVIKGYEYNGTIAPGKTTYYGLWDRYISFGKKTYPWGLHPRWQTPPPELDLSIPNGFASTNDIVGGNSGSSVINQKMEVVGLVHDGNLESLAGHFIFDETNNRTVATDSWGLIEALKYVYKTDRLVDELLNSKLK
ncbi:MAG: S46 family peptidase [Melioribacteraceae bacterium]|nr:S46 family peptidase [Melioribacteraceae bacterium]